MKKLITFFAVFTLILCFSCAKETRLENIVREGDIIFHTSLSSQSRAIQLATNSPYSHCGIIYKINGQWYVYEAVQPVKLTPLKEWVNRGKDGKYSVKRLKEADSILTTATLGKMQEEGKKFNAKNYDLLFAWSDDKIYCSELVWKIYKKGAGIEIGRLEQFKDFDLSSKEVQDIVQKRYGSKMPLNETVITPVSIFNSDKLLTVTTNMQN
ncbi:YycO [Elusimicrobium posterum]|uniref:YiiX family permuted papain-like enzyme n=1 Tax=Elusimicrobium posterum TaxID=3116653 RepID=UPI003C717FB2